MLLKSCIYDLNLSVSIIEKENFVTITRSIAIIASILSGLIMGYLTSMTIQIRREKRERHSKMHELTQQVHNFRRILHILMNFDEFWRNGLSSHMKNHHKNLSFFQLQEGVNEAGFPLVNVENSYADKKFGNIRQLYLEIKSIVLESYPDITLYSDYEENQYFSLSLLANWVNHDCGNGLWYFLDEHYSDFRFDVDFSVFFQENHLKARDLAMKIDKERFSDFKISPEELSKLGSYMHGHVFVKLYQVMKRQYEGVPSIFNYLYLILSLLIVFGIILPIIGLIMNFNQNTIIYYSCITVSIALYTILSFYERLKTTIYY